MELAERAARCAQVDALEEAGILGPEGAGVARGWIGGRLDWRGWLDRALLGLGATLVAAGVVFFFAYNWASIPAMAKFGLVQAGLVAGAVATWAVGLDCLTGKVMLAGCSVLVGVLLAVFGQVYQTGADAWQLFAGWAALIAGWAVAGRFVPLWMMVAGLLDLTLVLGDFPLGGTLWNGVAWGALNGAFLLVAEAARATGVEWAQGRWHRNLLWAACLIGLTGPALALVWSHSLIAGALPGFALWAAALAAGYAHYRHGAPDVTALALGGASAGFVALALVLRNLVYGFLRLDMGVLFIGAVCAVGIAAALGAWLRAAAAQMKEVADV